MRLIKHHESEVPRSIQLYGVDPRTISEAVKFLVDEDLCDHIDLNFGCPVPKVTKKGGGAALPWKKSLFRQIVEEAVKAAGDIPVTVKMRKGIDENHLTYQEAGQSCRRRRCCLNRAARAYRRPVLFRSRGLGRYR
jgi:tRNA-dihydrouridine synthase